MTKRQASVRTQRLVRLQGRREPRTNLVSSSSESLHDDGLVGVLASDGKDGLSDVDSGNDTVGLTPSASHTLRQPGDEREKKESVRKPKEH